MKATFYEYMRYHVASETDPSKPPYLVDLFEKTCSCPDFDIRVASLRQKDECKHLPVAYEAFGREMAEQIRNQYKRTAAEQRHAPGHD